MPDAMSDLFSGGNHQPSYKKKATSNYQNVPVGRQSGQPINVINQYGNTYMGRDAQREYINNLNQDVSGNIDNINRGSTGVATANSIVAGMTPERAKDISNYINQNTPNAPTTSAPVSKDTPKYERSGNYGNRNDYNTISVGDLTALREVCSTLFVAGHR